MNKIYSYAPYGTDSKLDKLVESKKISNRIKAARYNYGLEKLINDSNETVRIAVAEQGFRLDIFAYSHFDCERWAAYDYLEKHGYKSIIDWAKDNNINIDNWINSENWNKRFDVARYGYGLDKLIYDENPTVRLSVENYLRDHNYKSVFIWAEDNNVNIDIEEWLNSNNYLKRLIVAKYGYGLDKLVNDENWEVRKAVAEQGYGLDILINDKMFYVREVTEEYLNKNILTIQEWYEQNKNKSSINLEDFIYKVEDSSKIKIETSYESVDDFFENTSDKSYEDNESIVFVTVDTNVPLIKIEKTKSKDMNAFKFIVDIDEIDFTIKNIFDTEEKFTQLLQSTIDTLHEYSQFNKYADELENCL